MKTDIGSVYEQLWDESNRRLRDYYAARTKPKQWEPPAPRDELIWAAIDLDGTLAESVWPQTSIGAPIWRNVDKLVELRHSGLKVVIHTARGWEHYEMIESWLNHYHIPWDKIVCAKLLARVYVDDKAVHESEASWLPAR